MKKNKLFKKFFIFIISVFVLSSINIAGASTSLPIKTSADGPDDSASDREIPKEYCKYDQPEDQVYDSDFIAVRRRLKVNTGEIFKVKVFLKNTGNMPWFSAESSCTGPEIYLGTDKPRDRRSLLHSTNLDDIEDTNWEGPNRIGMDQLRTDPGEIASFTFYSKAPDKPDVYKEYFTPIIEAVTWLEDSEFSFELIIGDVKEKPSILRQKMSFSSESGSVLDLDLNAPKTILVDISDQRMYLKLGDKAVRSFQVSTGKSATPTPYGTTQISLKQEVRIAGKAPHYIMPKFMMFRAGGYGIHALPSLAYDGGYFWTEARNHIGIPVSHGCIRLLPEDADFLFDFTPIGTKVVVQP